MIKIGLEGYFENAEDLRNAYRIYPKVVDQELQAFGERGVNQLKKMVLERSLGLPPKLYGTQIPLYDSGKYINSYVAQTKNGQLRIFSEGQNDHMSNAALGDLLEYGNGKNVAPKPHLRPLLLWMTGKEREVPKNIILSLFRRP